MEWLVMQRWSPYAVGVGIGILNCLLLLSIGRFIGCSTAYSRVSGMIERVFRGKRVVQKPYYRIFAPIMDWETALLIGVGLGAWLSASVSGTFEAVWVPSAWRATFGASPMLRVGAALAGGILLGFGARWAGGCTSGHGISGTMQLAVSSWVASLSFFAGGIVTAMIMYRIG